MIFRVPKNFEGSCVLNTLKQALRAGTTISICGNKLYAPDVRRAIEQGLLEPMDPKYKKKDTSSNVMIVNKTNQVLVLGDLVLRPTAALMVDRDAVGATSVQAAKKNNLVNIIYGESTAAMRKKSSIKKKAQSTKKKKVKTIKPKTIKKKDIKSGEDIDVEPVVWDFKTKKTKKAEKVPKTPNVIRIDEEKDEKEVDFIDKKPAKKKRKKTTRKKSRKKISKKKDKHLKKKKVKAIKPVGDVRPPKTVADAAIELDSRGNVIKKASDELQHMIDSLSTPKEMSFVDEEQKQAKLEKRKNK